MDLRTPASVGLNRRLRSLWEEHIYWTRLTVNGIVGRLPDEADTTARLLRNADDFAAVFRTYYGQADAAELAWLMREHFRLLTLEVATRLEGRYKEDVALYDQIESQALEMADVMTSGIVQQFPRAFAS